MPVPSLPKPIADYFAADPLGADAVARCFVPTAVVKDEGRTHVGHDAIRAWKAAASAAYAYACVPRDVARAGDLHVVTGRVTGAFPGSPVDLRYRFRVEQGLIASLEIVS